MYVCKGCADVLGPPTPSRAGIANAIFSFITFIITLPGLATGSRTWLKAAGYLIVVNAIMTMAIGLDLWLVTLKMRENFSNIWNDQTDAVQGLMQTAVSNPAQTPEILVSAANPQAFRSIDQAG